MRSRKKLSKTERIIRKCIYTVIIVVLFIVVFFELTVKDRIELAIIAQIKTVSHSTINKAVGDYIDENNDICNSMVNINCDDSGNVRSITENMYSVNSLKSEVIDASQKSIDGVMREHGINVQLGNFTGLTILSDFGPYIHMDIDATTTITCEIVTSFESAGVNQTLHSTKLQMNVDIYVGNPIRIESISYTTSFDVSQTVIVGNIPSTYGTISRY